jgi:CBS domain-containing protein
MNSLTANDIMHPRLSIQNRERVPEILKKLMSPYPALPVVNENRELMGIISEDEILNLIMQERDTYGSLAQAFMVCGHPDHVHCGSPVSVNPETPIEEIVEIMHKMKLALLPVVKDGKLAGIISRKQIVTALAETGFWPGHEHLRMKKGYLGGLVAPIKKPSQAA